MNQQPKWLVSGGQDACTTEVLSGLVDLIDVPAVIFRNLNPECRISHDDEAQE